MIDEDNIGPRSGNRSGDFFEFAAADKSGRIQSVATLYHFADHFGAGAGRELAKLHH